MSNQVPLYQYLDTTGDGTGDTDMAVDGSGTPVHFKCQPAAGQIFAVQRMIMFYTDGAVFASGKYAALATALANGIEFGVYNNSDGSLAHDLLGGLPITVNADWGRACFDSTPDNFGIGNTYLTSRWSFYKDLGRPLYIGDDQHLAMIINDDLLGLNGQFASIRGEIIKGGV